MNNQTIYWVWIQNVLGFSSWKLGSIVEQYTFAEDFFRASLEEKLIVCEFTPAETERLKKTDLEHAGKIIQQCRMCGIDIVSYSDEAYPELLRHIPSPPAVLYVRGDITCASKLLCIAVIGTRKPTASGRENAYKFAYDLAAENVCVVSGGALGIDIQAHKGALHGKGKTICVLGCGHEAEYLKSFDGIKKVIEKNGAVISEYPSNVQPSRYTFPARNRIISGLSRGVVVVEAGKRSGTLITVSAANEQGRDVFAVPGDINNIFACGTNELIKDGAKPVTNVTDIICEYRPRVRNAKTQENSNNTSNNTDDIYTYGQMSFSQYLETEVDPIQDNRKESIADIGRKQDNEEIPRIGKDENPREKVTDISEKNKTHKDVGRSTVGSMTEELPGGLPAVNKKKPEKASQRPESKSKRTLDNPEKIKSGTRESKTLPDDLSENAVLFYNALREGKLHIDVVAERTGLPISAVHAAATELEMSDLIEAMSGRIYRIIE